MTDIFDTHIVAVEYVDHDPAYGFFGKVVARSDVRDMTTEEREAEIREMRDILGAHVAAVEVYEVPAIV